MGERTLSRRQVLGLTSAVGAALALPTVAGAAEYRSPFPALYARMIDLRDKCAAIDLDELAFEDACERLSAVQDEILCTMPVTAEDFAYQIVTVEESGDQSDGSAWAAPLAATAYLFLGLPIPELTMEHLAEFQCARGCSLALKLLAQVDKFISSLSPERV